MSNSQQPNHFSELKSSSKELTKILIGIFIASAIISGYVLQRSYSAFVKSNGLVDEIVQTHYSNNTQVIIQGLPFTYQTMNFLWPVVLFVFAYIGNLCLQKQLMINKEIRKFENGKVAFLTDPLNLYQGLELVSTKKTDFFIKIGLYLPLIALASHLFIGIWVLIGVIDSDSLHSPEATISYDLIVEFCLMIFISIIFLILLHKIPRQSYKLLKAFNKGE